MGCMLHIAGKTFCLRPKACTCSMAVQETRQGRTSDGKCEWQPAPEQVDGVRRIGWAGVRDDQRAQRASRTMLAPETGQPLSLVRVVVLLQAQCTGGEPVHCTCNATTWHALCMVWTYLAISRHRT